MIDIDNNKFVSFGDINTLSMGPAAGFETAMGMSILKALDWANHGGGWDGIGAELGSCQGAYAQHLKLPNGARKPGGRFMKTASVVVGQARC